MNTSEQNRFNKLYNRHLRAFKLQAPSDKAIDVYSRTVRLISAHHDCCPEQLTAEQLEVYFSKLVESHTWCTVKVGRLFTRACASEFALRVHLARLRSTQEMALPPISRRHLDAFLFL